jgi:Putative transposase
VSIEVRFLLARYLRGGPLAKQRLVAYGQETVTFRYRVNGEASDRPLDRPAGRFRLVMTEMATVT